MATPHECAAVPRWDRIEGSYTCVSLNFRRESDKEEGPGVVWPASCADEEIGVNWGWAGRELCASRKRTYCKRGKR